jgi:hypothetical protein
MVNSSFYVDGGTYDTATVTSNDVTSSGGTSTAPSSFYPEGSVYDALRDSDGVVAQMQALEAATAASATSASNSATNAATSASSAATSLSTLLSSLVNYVTNSSLATTLLSYVTNSSLASTLTSYAPLLSPTFTGTPAAPTQATMDNSTHIATTAYVDGKENSFTTPVMDGTATIGASHQFARADHVHPTDTSRAPLASPAFTGSGSITGNFTVGPGGTGSTSAALVISGGSTGPGGGGYAAFTKNGANGWFVGNISAVLGTTSADYVLYSATAGSIYTAGYTTGVVTFNGSPLVPTAAALDNSTKAASTAYVDRTVRDKLTSARTYYVDAAGSDSNTGLVNSAGGAFLTVAKALAVAGALDAASSQLTIQINAGTWTVPIVLPRMVGALPPILTGVGSTTIINVTGTCINNDGGTPWQVNNMKLVASTIGFNTANTGVIKFQGIEFGTAGSYHILVNSPSVCAATGAYTITGGAQYHVAATGRFDGGQATVTLTGTPAFSGGFMQVGNCGYAWLYNSVYTGAATGPKCYITGNAVCFTGGAATISNSFFPGNVSGTVNTGGILS